jgi:hypothetical protein
MLFAGAVLALSLFTGCKQGNGDRCEVPSDCASNFCIRCPGGDFQNMTCSDPMNPICPATTTGTGGSTGAGGATGTGGATGDSGIDTAPDAPSTAADAGDDGSTD